MINRIKIILAIAVMIGGSLSAKAATNDTPSWDTTPGFHYEVNTGFNIGGAAPLPMPAEIRKIEGYNPNLNLRLGAKASYWFANQDKWGIAAGVRFETKGMKTDAKVKNYGMEIIQDGSRVSGRWTGKVHTNYSSTQLAIPVTALYRLNDRWMLEAGPYIALALNNDFNGHVYDGYLREGDPTGEKVTFEGDAQAAYNFSDDIRTFQWGIQAGGSWLATKHLSVNANLTWGCNGIFNSSFKTVTFSLFPIYLNLGFSYLF